MLHTNIEKILATFCRENETGIKLLPAAVGTGKTYKTLEYMAQNYDASKRKLQFVYVAPSKKLVEEASEKLMQMGVAPKDFLKAYPNEDGLLAAGFDEDRLALLKENQDFFKNNLAATMVAQLVGQLKNLGGDNSKRRMLAEDLSRRELKLSTREMVMDLKRTLKQQCPTLAERKQAVEKGDWQMVSELFPNTLIYEKPIVLMTLDKFLLPFVTPIENYGYFYSNRLLKNTTIFFDEIDTLKELAVNRWTTSATANGTDIIDKFRQVGSVFERIPYSALAPTSQEYLRPQVTVAREIYQNIMTDYDLLNRVKSVSDAQKRLGSPFLLQDVSNWILIKGLYYVADEKEQVNYVSEDKSPLRLNTVVKRIEGFLTGYMLPLLRNIAQAYNLTEEKKDDEYINCITSILSTCGLQDRDHYFREGILALDFNRRAQKSRTQNFDIYSFYRDGFSEFVLEDADSHGLDTYVYHYAIRQTFEQMLVNLAANNRVIGLSATSLLETVLGNLSLKYLRQASDNFVETDAKEFAALQADYHAKNPYKEKGIKLSGKIIRAASNDDLAKLDLDRKQLMWLRKLSQNEPYIYNRFSKLLLIYDEFLKHKDQATFLCMLNQLPRKGGNLDADKLRSYFNILRVNNGLEPKKTPYSIVDAAEFRKGRLGYQDHTDKVFVITTYASAGQGVNLDYEFGNEVEVVQLSETKGTTKDFDAAYFERPTYIMPIKADGPTNEVAASALLYIHKLEEMWQNGELFYRDLQALVRKWYCNKPPHPKEKLSYQNALLRKLFQGLGRLSRTTVKNQTIYLYADSEIEAYLPDKEIFFNQQIIFTHEAIYFFKLFYEQAQPNNRTQVESWQVYWASQSLALNVWIKQMITAYQYDYQRAQDVIINWQKKWQEIRRIALRHLTLTQTEYEKLDEPLKMLYLKTPKKLVEYHYQTEDDFEKIVFSLAPKKGFQTVSLSNARIDLLTTNPDIKDYFDKHTYQRQETLGEYILAAPVFKNFYKGALGEELGRLIFEKTLGYELTELEVADFEKFDFRLKRAPEVYIDFKHWNSASWTDEDEMLEKIANKAQSCGAKVVIVANLLAKKHYRQVIEKDRDGIKIIQIASLLTEDAQKVNEVAKRKINEVIRDYAGIQ